MGHVVGGRGAHRGSGASGPGQVERRWLASQEYRDLSAAKLAVGDLAFTFRLPRLESGRDDGATVALADFAGVKPVALILGSYT